MQTKTVTHERPGEPLSVTVSEADVLMGMRHAMLISEAQALFWPDESAKEEDKQPEEPAEKEDKPFRLEGEELGGA